MKVLLNSCVWGGARAELVANGHDVIWAGDWVEDPGDDEILARAHHEGRVLVTLDKDFGELAVVSDPPPAVTARRASPVGQSSRPRHEFRDCLSAVP